MEIKRNILFFAEAEKGKDDAKLRMRIRWGANVVNFNVGHRIDPNKWSVKTQRCLANTTNKKKASAKIINSDIQKLHDRAEDIFKVFETKNIAPSQDEFRNEFNTRSGKKSKVIVPVLDFWGVFDAFGTETGRLRNWTSNTFVRFLIVKKYLLGFDAKLTFEKINVDLLTDYVIYLWDVREQRASTIKKQIVFLKGFFRWAADKGLINNKALDKFKPKLKEVSKKTIVFLYWDELITVYNKELPEGGQLDKTRDAFCFCAFTSLRYSDVKNLRKSDIYQDHIQLTTIKTGDTLEINLNKYSRAIMDKYKDYQDPENKAMPVLPIRRMNHYLKELGEVCELNRMITETYYRGNERIDNVQPLSSLLSTHAARRTFISNALMMGITAETVMKWTGHSDYKAMKPYIDIAESAKRDGMALFDQR